MQIFHSKGHMQFSVLAILTFVLSLCDIQVWSLFSMFIARQYLWTSPRRWTGDHPSRQHGLVRSYNLPGGTSPTIHLQERSVVDQFVSERAITNSSCWFSLVDIIQLQLWSRSRIGSWADPFHCLHISNCGCHRRTPRESRVKCDDTQLCVAFTKLKATVSI